MQIIETNFESIKAKLHYGNFDLETFIIYTEIEEQLIEINNCSNGAFGIVRFVEF